jgi:hypothetical protein
MIWTFTAWGLYGVSLPNECEEAASILADALEIFINGGVFIIAEE